MKSKIATMFIMVFGFVLLSALPVTATGTGSDLHPDHPDICKVVIVGADCDCVTLEVSGCDVDLLTIEYLLTITAVRCDSEDPKGGMFIRGSATISGLHPDTIEICYIEACVDGGCSIEEYLQSGGPFLPSVTATISHGTTHHTVVAENEGITIPDCEPDIPQGLCDKSNPDKPKVQILTMEYLGGACVIGCENDGNDQDNTNEDPNKHKVQCDNVAAPDPFPTTVFIIASDKRDPLDSRANTWFSDEVTVDDEFDINAMQGGKTKLGANTYLFIFDKSPMDGGVLLQKLLFHTSCSQPLAIGNVFCIVEVKGLVLE